MKVAVIGSGGREHALLKALHDSESNPECYFYPGNPGMQEIGEPLPVDSDDEIVSGLQDKSIDLCVVGPESYLQDELADECREQGILCWGPVKESAKLETSKLFAKQFMNRHDVPTGGYSVAESPEEIRNQISGYPCVLKYDGLAGGKGVSVCLSEEDVDKYIEQVFEEKRFGETQPILVEEHLEGEELTVICAVVDGDYQMFRPSRDYKRLLDNDRGPNTGGMGAVSAKGIVSDQMLDRIEQNIIQPTMQGLRTDGMQYRGFLYFGLMITTDGPRILEYNCRFGDPEAQATLPLVQGDLAGYLKKAAEGELDKTMISFLNKWAVCVMLASRDYPYHGSRGEPIVGFDKVGSTQIYHSGTRMNDDGKYEVDGGRVLGLVSLGDTREEARDTSYQALENVYFDGMQYRSDIAKLHFEEESDQASN